MAHVYHNQSNTYIKREPGMNQRQNLTPERTPEYRIKQEQDLHHHQQERESTVGTIDPESRTEQWLEGTSITTTQNTTITPDAPVTQNSMASSRYIPPQIPANASPALLNRMASNKRLLEDDSIDQMQYAGSPANKRRRHENNFRGMRSDASSSNVPRIKLDPSANIEVLQMHRVPENDVIEICKTCTSGNLTRFEAEQLTEIQIKIDWVFNHGAKSFDIRSEIKSRIPHQPPTAYGLILKPEHNRRIDDLQKRMRDAQNQIAAQRARVEPPSTPRNRKIKNCRARSAKSPSVPAQPPAPIERVIGMLQLNDASISAVIQTTNNLLASKNLKITMAGGALHLVDLATQP